MQLKKRQLAIVEAALRLTASGGLGNLTVKKLAGELGVTEPALYRHFLNKSEIVKAMIGSFESVSDEVFVRIESEGVRGLSAVELFVKNRFQIVLKKPALSKVMFSEEQFIDEPEYSSLLLGMMHRHKENLCRMLREAQADGTVRSDIRLEMMFRLIFGPVRLLIKQWGMSQQGFDLLKTGDEMWEDLRKILSSGKERVGDEKTDH
ncbi:MAG: TetR family transcriptional regulator [Lentisphaeria bacterium]|nr:TetR family transcriptional regulator [Lentisphaeria bacterium]